MACAGSANALITASLAANRAASLCTRLRPWQSLISLAVKTLRRYRSPNVASESWTSSIVNDVASDADAAPVDLARQRDPRGRLRVDCYRT